MLLATWFTWSLTAICCLHYNTAVINQSKVLTAFFDSNKIISIFRQIEIEINIFVLMIMFSLEARSSSTSELSSQLTESTLSSTTARVFQNRELARGGVVADPLTSSYLGVIVVLSILVVGGVLFMMCRLLYKAAALSSSSTRHVVCQNNSLLYSAESLSISVPIDLFSLSQENSDR